MVGPFGTTPSNLHRLTNATLEDTGTGGLCKSCHDATIYPRNHHPSYYNTSFSRNVIMSGSQEALIAVGGSTIWTNYGGYYGQNAYGAQIYSTNVDRFINWWSGTYGDGNQDPPPRPVFYGENQSQSPKAILPLSQYVVGGGENRVMCVTCHNPHGTDLYTFIWSISGDVRQVPDNNMLRLLDDDDTLCAACH